MKTFKLLVDVKIWKADKRERRLNREQMLKANFSLSFHLFYGLIQYSGRLLQTFYFMPDDNATKLNLISWGCFLGTWVDLFLVKVEKKSRKWKSLLWRILSQDLSSISFLLLTPSPFSFSLPIFLSFSLPIPSLSLSLSIYLFLTKAPPLFFLSSYPSLFLSSYPLSRSISISLSISKAISFSLCFTHYLPNTSFYVSNYLCFPMSKYIFLSQYIHTHLLLYFCFFCLSLFLSRHVFLNLGIHSSHSVLTNLSSFLCFMHFTLPVIFSPLMLACLLTLFKHSLTNNIHANPSINTTFWYIIASSICH